MGRKRKGKTSTIRVRLTDVAKLRANARSLNLTLPDYLTLIARRRILKGGSL